MIMKKSGKRGYSCLVPDHRGKASSFSSLNVGFFYFYFCCSYIKLKTFPSVHSLLRIFVVIGCWILASALCATIDMMM